MTFIEEDVITQSNYRLHIVPTEKFKTTTVMIQVKRKLTDEDVTKRALLPYVLQSGTEQWPSAKQIRNELETLYGASFHVDLAKKGENHIMTFRLDVANEKFIVDREPLFEKAVHLLAEILLHPKTTDQSSFAEDIVRNEKRALKQRIQATLDDKMSYASLRLIEEMCANEPFRQHVYGKYDKVDSVSAKDLFDYYQDVLRHDEIDIYVVGNVDEKNTQSVIESAFVFPADRKPLAGEATITHVRVENEKEYIEEQDVNQGKLNIGFRTYTTFKDDDFPALQVCNGIFGGFSHSKLFINVREKESLAYYAASRIESHKGLLLVMSGIESANYEKTVTIIKDQMEKMKNGDFTDNEFQQTKTMLRNQLLETIDDPRGIVEILYNQIVAQQPRHISEILQGIEAVTRDDVILVAEKIALDTVYFLKERGERA